jgi:anti-sigma regulatory factor (Ser/Thr protein kinase)
MTPMAPTRPNRTLSPPAPAAPFPPPAAGSPAPGLPLPGSPLPGGRPQCSIPLMADLAAAAAARAVVADVIRAWRVPVDADAAVLLTSELVTNAVTHAGPSPATFVLLTVARDASALRVDVHDGSADLPVLDEAPAEAETGRGLLLVTLLSDEWGFYRTSVGKAVYFTLGFAAADHPATGENGRPG